MRLKHILALLGLCAVAPGCAPLKQVARVIICEPAAYCLGMDETVACMRDSDLAQEAWAHFSSAVPDNPYSEDFAAGFKDGFADYLWAGGNGEPPAIPPRQYWTPNYQSPDGIALMNDWFRGFRLGAAVARDSGYREAVIIPASTRLPRTELPSGNAVAPTKPMPYSEEPLPMPKPVQNPKGAPAPRPQSPAAQAQPPQTPANLPRPVAGNAAAPSLPPVSGQPAESATTPQAPASLPASPGPASGPQLPLPKTSPP
jgi:hypothetical protein